MSHLIFDPHNNDDIEDALQMIHAGDKNAIPEFLSKLQGIDSNLNSGNNALIQTTTGPGVQSGENNAYFELAKQIAKLKEEKNQLNGKFLECQAKSNTLDDQINQLNANNEALKNKIKELKDINKSLEDKVNTINEEKSTLEELVKEAEEKVKTKEDEMIDVRNKCETKIRDKENELNNKYKEEIRKLQIEIRDLKKNLEKYEVPSGVTGEIRFFKVNDNRLSDTLADNAPYIGKVMTDGTISYQFNIEKGKVQDSIQKRETILEPFCDIINAIEGGNTIQWAERGLLRENGGTYDIIKKAKIKIVLQ